MNKKEYLDQLRNELSRLPKDERDAAVSYYEEFFIEAGDEDEQAVITRLGNVSELAKAILIENGIDPNQKQAEKDASIPLPPTESYQATAQTNPSAPNQSRTLLMIIIAIVTFPFWFSILMTIFGLLIAGVATVFGLIVAAIALGTAGIGFGIYSLTFAPAIGFLTIGVSLIALGIILVIVFPLAKALTICAKYLFKGIGRFFKSIFNESGVSA